MMFTVAFPLAPLLALVALKEDFAEVGKDEIGWKGHLLGSILNFGGLQCSLFS